jgi:hypothetical protein
MLQTGRCLCCRTVFMSALGTCAGCLRCRSCCAAAAAAAPTASLALLRLVRNPLLLPPDAKRPMPCLRSAALPMAGAASASCCCCCAPIVAAISFRPLQHTYSSQHELRNSTHGSDRLQATVGQPQQHGYRAACLKRQCLAATGGTLQHQSCPLQRVLAVPH